MNTKILKELEYIEGQIAMAERDSDEGMHKYLKGKLVGFKQAIEVVTDQLEQKEVVINTMFERASLADVRKKELEMLYQAVNDILPFLEKTTDPAKPLYAVLVTPAEQMRRRAAELEKKDEVIQKLRDLMKVSN